MLYLDKLKLLLSLLHELTDQYINFVSYDKKMIKETEEIREKQSNE